MASLRTSVFLVFLVFITTPSFFLDAKRHESERQDISLAEDAGLSSESDVGVSSEFDAGNYATNFDSTENSVSNGDVAEDFVAESPAPADDSNTWVPDDSNGVNDRAIDDFISDGSPGDQPNGMGMPFEDNQLNQMEEPVDENHYIPGPEAPSNDRASDPIFEQYSAGMKQAREQGAFEEEKEERQNAYSYRIENGAGLSKTVLTEGDKEHFPKVGDILKLKYVARLAKTGEVFDSRGPEEGLFEFKVGRQEVIPGWDTGIREFSEGEHAILHVPSALAYGEHGVDSHIPPNADLDFEIELVSITKSGLSKGVRDVMQGMNW